MIIKIANSNRKWPVHGWIGLALILVFWPLNWLLPGLRSAWGFFPMWVGYCLTIDALVFIRKGSSMFTRNSRAYIVLFIISAPSWWIFELLNLRVQNWFYEGREFFTDFQYFIISTICFSTVIPAVFGTAEFVGTFKWIRDLKTGFIFGSNPRSILIMFICGWIFLSLLLIWPLYFFPFMWISVLLILEPVNYWQKNKSLIKYTSRGDWRIIISLFLACLICGFFWEMWNFYSYPKWIYKVPFVDFLHIFEMPILGYFGYLPFALELFVLYHLITGFFNKRKDMNFIRISE